MIDPKALQQHFRKVQQTEKPPKIDVPRVPDVEPLTAVQAIPEPVIEQETFHIPGSSVFDTLKEEVKEEEVIQEVNKEDSYDPYGYYSSPSN
jgi:hypothetical protein